MKRLLAMWKTRVRSLGQEDPWRRNWQPTPVLLPGKFHGWGSLVGSIGGAMGSQRVKHDQAASLHL